MSAIGQISFPVRAGTNGELATVDPDSTQYVAEQAHVLCLTPLGAVPGQPELGLADQRFRKGGADTDGIEAQIRRWIPDAETAVEHDPRLLDRGLDELGVQVTR